MANLIFEQKVSLTNEQIAAIYALAEKFKVGICLYGNTPSPARDSFTWSISGGLVRVFRFLRQLKAIR